MTTDFIDHYFHSELERIEDEFVGVTIHPNGKGGWVIVERIFYKTYGEFEVDEWRISKKEKLDAYDYENNYNHEYNHTTLNYKEIDLDFWKEYLYSYEEGQEKEINSFFRNIDTYIQSTKDLQTKKFTLNYIRNRILYCISRIETDIPERIKKIHSQELNLYKKVLLQTFHTIYFSYKRVIESEKYGDFIEKKEQAQVPLKNSNSLETVFGKNFDFIEKLYTELCEKDFIDISKEQFIRHFYIDEQPDNPITIKGGNLSDCAMLINKLKEFFLEKYQTSSFYNQFWADRFLFDTYTKKGICKNKKGISRMRSAYEKGDRPPIKKSTINEIAQNLKSNLQ